MKRSIFISYRRDNAAGFSSYIYERLIEHVPKNRVFMDVLGIDPGADFVNRLESAVESCDVLLALFGKGGRETPVTGKREFKKRKIEYA